MEGINLVRLLVADAGRVTSVGRHPSQIRYGSTPLHDALSNRNEAVARLLIDGGADVSAADKYGSTPLLHAASNESEAVAQVLIDGGAEVLATEKDGSTQLCCAGRNKRMAVARLLRIRGATGAPLIAVRAPTISDLQALAV